MSPRIPRATASEVIRVLEKLGFSLSRQSGSHKIYHNSAGNRAVGPYHAGKILHPKVLKDIISCTGLIIEEFESLLKDA